MQREIPRGTILGWSGSVAAIPSTFRLCDGTRTTPDLRDRFIVGAGSGYAPANVGGSFVHVHPMLSALHMHGIAGGADIVSGIGFENLAPATKASGISEQNSNVLPYYALAFVMYDGRPL